jgi:hypothetical protein
VAATSRLPFQLVPSTSQSVDSTRCLVASPARRCWYEGWYSAVCKARKPGNGWMSPVKLPSGHVKSFVTILSADSLHSRIANEGIRSQVSGIALDCIRQTPPMGRSSNQTTERPPHLTVSYNDLPSHHTSVRPHRGCLCSFGSRDVVGRLLGAARSQYGGWAAG